ncbi:hypothetical protein MGU_08100 [Metarhizium guizhouense ARSEF 977]|uniref:Uncharacterized protein n=1 Tax=Metarhizium guizhouense (strain ARSEF 977) TaxID=1276136 RepID=A0A0B4GCW3_METGA|nr:hypothetical protein MGU_08100 [Metarhizium guizhouense ARSEF 977]
MLYMRHRRTFEDDLYNAIEVSYKASKALPPGYQGLANQLQKLSEMFFARYERNEADADLGEAISKATAAVSATTVRRADPVADFNSADGLTLGRMTRSFGNIWKAVNARSEKPANLADRLSSLSTMLVERYEQGHQGGQDLDSAIASARDAVEASPPNDPTLASRLEHLGRLLWRRHCVSVDKRDVEELNAVASELENLAVC